MATSVSRYFTKFQSYHPLTCILYKIENMLPFILCITRDVAFLLQNVVLTLCSSCQGIEFGKY